MTDTGQEFLTVHELAALLRIKERKVYDLAASGQLPVSRATGKLLFPEAEVRAWIDGNSTGRGRKADVPKVLLGSHDPLLEWAVRQSQCGLATLLDGSTDGLDRFGAGEGLATGLHIFDGPTATWNVPAASKTCGTSDAVLITWAKRRRGFLTRSGDKMNIKSMMELEGKKVASRPSTAGANILLMHLMEDAGIDPKRIDVVGSAHSEQDAVLAVVEGSADVTFGLEVFAKQFNLEFSPIIEERFDLLVNRQAYFETSFQSLLSFCGSGDFLARAAAMGGYDVSELGAVRWNA